MEDRGADAPTAGWTHVVLTQLMRYGALLLVMLVIQSFGGRMMTWEGLIAGVALGVGRGIAIRVAARAAGPQLLETEDSREADRLFRATSIGRAIVQLNIFLVIGLGMYVLVAMFGKFRGNELSPVNLALLRSLVPAYFAMHLVSWGAQLPLPNGGKVVRTDAPQG